MLVIRDDKADEEAKVFSRNTDREMAYQRRRGAAIRSRIERMLDEAHEVESHAEATLPDMLVR